LRRKDGSPSRCDRQFLLLAAGAAALPAASRSASAEVYPTRPVRLIVGFRRSRIVANSPLASGLLRGIAARTPCISQNAGYESDGRQPHMNTDVVPPLAANMNAARSGRGVEPPGLRPRYFPSFSASRIIRFVTSMAGLPYTIGEGHSNSSRSLDASADEPNGRG
jgi:hypothetical protein